LKYATGQLATLRNTRPRRQRHFDIAADRVRVRANGVRFGNQRLGRRLGVARQIGLERDGQAEAAAVALADADLCGDACTGYVELLVARDVVESAAEASRIAGRKKMLGRRRAGFAGAAHLFRDRQIDRDAFVGRFGMAIAAADCGRLRREQNFHRRTSDFCR